MLRGARLQDGGLGHGQPGSWQMPTERGIGGVAILFKDEL